MAGYFNLGEEKTRPGAYFNVQKRGVDASPGAVDGVVAVLFRSTFGPLGKAIEIDALDGYESIFGTGGKTDALKYAIQGGATKLIAYRVGTGGTAATTTLVVGESGTLTITAKYPGTMSFTVTVRPMLTDSTQKEVIFYSGTTELEKHSFTASADEASACVAAINESSNFTAASSSTGVVAAVSQQAFTAGTDPTVTNSNYSSGLNEIEKYYFNAIIVDSEDTAIHALVANFLTRIYSAGQFAVAFFAELSSVALATRESHAAAYNSENVAYVLNASLETLEGNIDGYQTAAIVAGMYAGRSAATSLTHVVLSGVVALREILTNSQMVAAEKSGCIVLSTNASGQVWFDNAINTLISLDSEHDAGWKKLRRVKTRYELMYRANSAADVMVGQVDNDANGRAAIANKIRAVINSMVAEGKLVSGIAQVSERFVSDADFCYFDIYVIDKDSAEKIYLMYTFQYSTNIE